MTKDKQEIKRKDAEDAGQAQAVLLCEGSAFLRLCGCFISVTKEIGKQLESVLRSKLLLICLVDPLPAFLEIQ